MAEQKPDSPLIDPSILEKHTAAAPALRRQSLLQKAAFIGAPEDAKPHAPALESSRAKASLLSINGNCISSLLRNRTARQ